VKHAAVVAVVLAACGDDGASGPALSVDMEVPITEGLNGTESVFDAIVGHTFGLSIVATTAPSSAQETNAECQSTLFDIATATRLASGDVAALVQTELLDMTTEATLNVETCTIGRPTVNLRFGAPTRQAFVSCFLEPQDLEVDADGFPRLASVTSSECEATIDDVAAFRNFQSATFPATFTVARTLP
jgi:hypothetical protein